MDMITSNQLGKITNAQFKKLQTQITQVILENEIQEIVQEGELTEVEHSIEDSLLGGIPAIKLRKKLTKLRFWKATDKTIIIESLLLSTATRFEHQVTGLLFNPIPEVVTCNNVRPMHPADLQAAVTNARDF
ncbi:hypothetical protein G9A89_008062 [Geosiphon pyriformis]|nr:hypothetical protein G9A89_008062 [Geosiphon pyriformis]